MATAFAIWGLISLIGFALFKAKRAGSWEDGIKLTLTGGIIFLINTFSNQPDTDSQINTSLYLTDTEILDLVDRFESRPYELPTLAVPVTYNNNCMWIDMKASGFTDPYRHTPLNQLRHMTESIVQRFYQRIRNLPAVSVYVKIMAPDRLLLAIPLSANGEKFLASQEPVAAIPSPEIPGKIEEEIDLFADMGKT